MEGKKKVSLVVHFFLRSFLEVDWKEREREGERRERESKQESHQIKVQEGRERREKCFFFQTRSIAVYYKEWKKLFVVLIVDHSGLSLALRAVQYVIFSFLVGRDVALLACKYRWVVKIAAEERERGNCQLSPKRDSFLFSPLHQPPKSGHFLRGGGRRWVMNMMPGRGGGGKNVISPQYLSAKCFFPINNDGPLISCQLSSKEGVLCKSC